jgi:hypothetical protein
MNCLTNVSDKQEVLAVVLSSLPCLPRPAPCAPPLRLASIISRQHLDVICLWCCGFSQRTGRRAAAGWRPAGKGLGWLCWGGGRCGFQAECWQAQHLSEASHLQDCRNDTTAGCIGITGPRQSSMWSPAHARHAHGITSGSQCICSHLLSAQARTCWRCTSIRTPPAASNDSRQGLHQPFIGSNGNMQHHCRAASQV